MKRGADKIHSRPAHVGERTHSFATMIKGRKAQRVLVDKSYASKENHADLRGKLRGDILHKVVRG